jgi:hypothetical protein
MLRDIGSAPGGLAELGAELAAQYGPLMDSVALARTLGFPSAGAFRQACYRGRISVPMFNVPGRTGRFALTLDVARWLWAMREAAREGGTGRRIC